jgi:alkylation response protein AidB-like acyl-CoA dehydrogenase
MIEAAEQLAARLRTDAAERDRAGKPPVEEIELLRSSGLLSANPDWLTANTITRIVSAADASVGHLLGYHYLQLWRVELFDHPRPRNEENHFWAGVSNPLDAALRLTPTADGSIVDGRKTFATGAMVADRLVVSATRTDTGEKVTFIVDAHDSGISYLDDWDNLGQRLTASGGVVFDAVPVAEVLGVQPDDPTAPGAVRLSLAALAFQVVLSQIYVGIAQGALAEAAGYTRTRTRPWFVSGVDSASADPYILAGYGELVAQVQAARLLTDAATAALGQAAARGSAITEEDRGRAAVAISSAKVLSTRVVTETTSKVFEFTGARATASSYGFDRFWRNARTLTLHDPVVYKAREVGEHFLTGAYPPFTGYS